jgi:hypothetical protein
MGHGEDEMFSMTALLTDSTFKISNNELFEYFKNRFKSDADFSISFQKMPFQDRDSLMLKWGCWTVRVVYEDDSQVKVDSKAISKTLDGKCEADVSNVEKRIRVVFEDDASKEHTDQIVDIMEFLTSIKVLSTIRKNLMFLD